MGQGTRRGKPQYAHLWSLVSVSLLIHTGCPEVAVGVRPRSQKQKHVTTCPLPPPWPQSIQGSAPQPQPHFRVCPAPSSMATDHLIWVSLAWMLSRFSHVWLFVTLWTIAHKVPLSMRFSRQEYWSGLPCPPPWYFPDPGIEPTSLPSPALAGSLPLAPCGKPLIPIWFH